MIVYVLETPIPYCDDKEISVYSSFNKASNGLEDWTRWGGMTPETQVWENHDLLGFYKITACVLDSGLDADCT